MSKAPRGNRSKGGDLSQYGLFDIPTDLNFDATGGSMDDEHDSDLEAELAALTGGGGAKPKRPVKKPIPDSDLDVMVAESLKDIPSDAELSGDDDDPDLLNELNEITGGDHTEPESESQPEFVQTDATNDVGNLLSERLKMYEEAEKNAKEAGETSRARRFNRGIKTIKDLIKQVNAGKSINNDDIPPVVSTSVRKPTDETENGDQSKPTRPAPSIPTPTEPEPEPVPEPQEESPESTEPKESAADSTPQIDTELINMLTERKNQYKIAALKAKKSGDSTTAINYIKIAKQFDIVIKAAEDGQPVDLSRMPDPPLDPQQQQHEKIEENKVQQHEDSIPQITVPEGEIPEETLIMASSIEEALQQRLEVYKKQEETAKEQGNSSKARRMGRIVKQFEQAMKLHKAGKPIPVDELPTPPGYGPIPVPGAVTTTTNKPEPPPVNISPEKPKSKPPQQPSTSQSTRISGNQMPNSRAEKQLVLLLAKQKEFKEAALRAKRKGEIEQAKEYLRTAKGFDPLIEAATCGLPVDLSTLPISPNAKVQLDNEYDVVMADECTDKDDTNLDVLSRLEAQLTKQLKMCLSTRDHHKALGDVAGTNRFERLALNVTKDLDLIRLAHRTPGVGVPKFHYEIKDFAIVKSFTELGDNELELAILRGISYTCTNAKEIDTYVKFEFPYPQDEPFKDRTPTVKDTNSPEYNQTFIIPIQRTARACQRIFKRQSVKFEVYSKGCWCASDLSSCFSGWFRGDTLIGTVNVKLQPLETQCELHDSFDLLEGRKKVGGKLEIRIRLRHPIVSQQIEQLQEKWLVIDN